jgi:hypothetical protein
MLQYPGKRPPRTIPPSVGVIFLVRPVPRRLMPIAVRVALALVLLVLLWPALQGAKAVSPKAQPLVSRPNMPGQAAAAGETAVYAGDISVPDGTVFAPGARFTKVWRIKNVGTVPWTTSFHWHFEAGTLMSGSLLATAVAKTAPGGTTIISVPMQAPMATGVYTSFWQMVDPSGNPFPHQAWVNVVVRNGAERGPTTPVAPDAPTGTPVPVSRATPLPTIAVPGGDGQMVSSAWVGATVYRAFFPAGSTMPGNGETLAIYYPGPKIAHVRVTLYRPDGAARSFQFALSNGQRQTLDLNRLAPNIGLSATVEGDRPLVSSRVYTARQGMVLEPGAVNTSRSWFFPALPAGAPTGQMLMMFNPGPASASVTIRVGNAASGCCASNTSVTVRPLAQYALTLGAPNTLRGPMTLSASGPIVAERLGESADHTAVTGVPGSSSPAKTWFLPSVWGSQAQGTVNVFNPSASSVLVTIRSDLDFGEGRWIERTLAPFSEWRLSVGELTTNQRLAADVSAGAPVVVSASWTAGDGLTATTLGSHAAAKTWSFVAGLGNQGLTEGIDLFNPSNLASAVRISVQGAHGTGPSWQIKVPAHGRASKALPAGTGQGGAGVIIQSARSIVVGRTFTGNSAGAAATASSLGS